MRVQIDSVGVVRLEDADDLSSLCVRAPEDLKAGERLARALAGIATPAGDGAAVWLSTDWLRGHGGRGKPADWEQRFDAMLAFAERHGWSRNGLREVRAHVEWTSP